MNDWIKTCNLIPDGVQTLSKMPSKHVEGVYPTYIDRAKGPYIYCGDKRYIDYPLGLGSIILGHADDDVNQAVKEQLDKGTIFSLPNYAETLLAEKICNLIPCAEMVRFLKTGSEACSAAVKIARAYTGRKKILCCGYHGWHDWYNATTPKNRGTHSTSVKQFKYNDAEGLKKLMSDKVAAVIMEPYVLDEPKGAFLKTVQKLCKDNKALLIFDEVITGFRTLGFSAQKLFEITPDLTCLGKAMGNGMPISAVCGKKDIMQVLENDCFVSSTFGGELASIAAALATLDVVERENVPRHIELMGSRLKEGFNQLASHLNLSDHIKCIGYPCRTFFKFPTETHKSLFWQECLGRGVFFGYAQFISYAHKMPELDTTVEVMGEALRLARKYWDKPEEYLQGKPAEETFRLVAQNETIPSD